jgi:hypothetical protein
VLARISGEEDRPPGGSSGVGGGSSGEMGSVLGSLGLGSSAQSLSFMSFDALSPEGLLLDDPLGTGGPRGGTGLDDDDLDPSLASLRPLVLQHVLHAQLRHLLGTFPPGAAALHAGASGARAPRAAAGGGGPRGAGAGASARPTLLATLGRWLVHGSSRELLRAELDRQVGGFRGPCLRCVAACLHPSLAHDAHPITRQHTSLPLFSLPAPRLPWCHPSDPGHLRHLHVSHQAAAPAPVPPGPQTDPWQLAQQRQRTRARREQWDGRIHQQGRQRGCWRSGVAAAGAAAAVKQQPEHRGRCAAGGRCDWDLGWRCGGLDSSRVLFSFGRRPPSTDQPTDQPTTTRSCSHNWAGGAAAGDGSRGRACRAGRRPGSSRRRRQWRRRRRAELAVGV